MVLLQAFLLFGAVFLYCNRAARQDAFVARPSRLPWVQQKRGWELLLPTVQLAEAGIPGLHKWMLETFPSAVQRVESGTVTETDHLLFDLNQLLHQAAASVKNSRWQDGPASASKGKGSAGFTEGNSHGGKTLAGNRGGGIAGRRSTAAGGGSVAGREAAAPAATTAAGQKAVEALEVQDENESAADEEEEIVLRRFLRLVSATLRRVRPRRSVVFAVDGVPPLAKFLTATARQQGSVWHRSGGLYDAETPKASQGSSSPTAAEEQQTNALPEYSAAPERVSTITYAPASPVDPLRLWRCGTETSAGENSGQQVNEGDRRRPHRSPLTYQDSDGKEHVIGSSTRAEDGHQDEPHTWGGYADTLWYDIRKRRQVMPTQPSRDQQTAVLLPPGETEAAHTKSPLSGKRTDYKAVPEQTHGVVEAVQAEAGAECQSIPLQTDSVCRYRIPPYLLIPGTRFMSKVEETCRRFAVQRLSTRRDSSLRFFISGSNSHGEGELKLADWLNAYRADVKEGGRRPLQKERPQGAAAPPQKGRQMLRGATSLENERGGSFYTGPSGKASSMPAVKRRAIARATTVLGGNNNEPTSCTARAFRVAPTDSIVVVGGDGDLLVQALACPGIPNLFVYCPQRLLSGSSGRCRVMYSLRALLHALERHFPGCSHLVRNDLALLCLLNGNDYLPKAGGFTFHHFFQAYTAVRNRPEFKRSSLIDAAMKSFNVEFFMAFLEELDSISSLWRIALQQLLAPPLGSPNHLTPLAMLNQLVAQGYLSLDLKNSKNAFVRNSGVGGTTDTRQGKGETASQSNEKIHEEGACQAVISSFEKGAKAERQFTSTTEPSVLQWRYEGNSPFGSGNFRAVLKVPWKALPVVAHPSVSGREGDRLCGSVGRGAVMGNEDAGVEACPVDGSEGDFVSFTGSARDKKGAQQQAALELLQRYFPAWLKYLRTAETSDSPAPGEKGDAKGMTEVDEGDCEPVERGAQQESGSAQVKEGKKQQLMHHNLPKEWRRAAPLFSAAASTLQATSPANTLNNLCLKVFKHPAKLWHVIPQRALDSVTEPESHGGHYDVAHAGDFGPSASGGVASAASSSCKDVGGGDSARIEATATQNCDAYLTQKETSSALRQTDEQQGVQTPASPAVASADHGDLGRPDGQQDTFIALDVGNLRLFSTSRNQLVEGGTDSGSGAKLQQPTSRRQEKHCFSMQVLQWLAPTLYRALLAAGWKLDGSLADAVDTRHQPHCESEVHDEKQQPDCSIPCPSRTGQQSPHHARDLQQEISTRGLGRPELAQIIKLDTSDPGCEEQLRQLMQRSLTCYFTTGSDRKSCEAQHREENCMHIADRELPSAKQNSTDGALQPSSNQHLGREETERTGADREAEMVKRQVERDTPRVCEYLKGLLWNMQMYVTGICPDTLWFFPFRKAPSLYSLQQHIKRGLAASVLSNFGQAVGAASVIDRTAAGSPPAPTHSCAAERICFAPLAHGESGEFTRADLQHDGAFFCGTADGGRGSRPIWTSTSSRVSGNPVSPALYAAAILPPVVLHWLNLRREQQQHFQKSQGEKGTDSCTEEVLKFRQKLLPDPKGPRFSSSWTNGHTDVPAEAQVVERGLGPTFARALLQARDLLDRIRLADVASPDVSSLTRPEAFAPSADCPTDERPPSSRLAPVDCPFSDAKHRYTETPTDFRTRTLVSSDEHAQVQNNVKEHHPQNKGALLGDGTNRRGHDADYLHVKRRPPPLAERLLSRVAAPHGIPSSSCIGAFSTPPDAPLPDSPVAPVFADDRTVPSEMTRYSLSAAESAAPASSSLSPRHILSASLLLSRAAASASAQTVTDKMAPLESPQSCSRKFVNSIRRPNGVKCSAKESSSRNASFPFTSGVKSGNGSGWSACIAEIPDQSEAARASSSPCSPVRNTTHKNEPALQALWMSKKSPENAPKFYPTTAPQQHGRLNMSQPSVASKDHLLYMDEKQDALQDLLPLISESSESVWTCIWSRYCGRRSGRRSSFLLSGISQKASSDRPMTDHTAETERLMGTRGRECKNTTGAAVEIQGLEKRSLGRQLAAPRTLPIWRARLAARRPSSIAEEEIPLFPLRRMNISWIKSMSSLISGRATNVRRPNNYANGPQGGRVPNTTDPHTRRERNSPSVCLHVHWKSDGQRHTHRETQTRQRLSQQLQRGLPEHEQREALSPGTLARPLQQLSVAQPNVPSEEEGSYPQQQKQWSAEFSVERSLQRQLQQRFGGTPTQQGQQGQCVSKRMQVSGEQVSQTRDQLIERVGAARKQPEWPAEHDRYESYTRQPPSSATHSALPGGRTTASRTPTALTSSPGNADTGGALIKTSRIFSAHGSSLPWKCLFFPTVPLLASALDRLVAGSACSGGFCISRGAMKGLKNLSTVNHTSRGQTSVYCGKGSASSSLQNQATGRNPRFPSSHTGDIVDIPISGESDESFFVPIVTLLKKCSFSLPERSCNCTNRYVASNKVRQLFFGKSERSPLQGALKKHQASGYLSVSGCLHCSVVGSPTSWCSPGHSFAELRLPGTSVCQWCYKRYVCCELAQTHVSCAACGNKNPLSMCRSASHENCSSRRPLKVAFHPFDATRTFLLTNGSKSQNTPFLQGVCRSRVGVRHSATAPCSHTAFKVHQARHGYSLAAQARAVAAACCLQRRICTPHWVGRTALCNA